MHVALFQLATEQNKLDQLKKNYAVCERSISQTNKELLNLLDSSKIINDTEKGNSLANHFASANQHRIEYTLMLLVDRKRTR